MERERRGSFSPIVLLVLIALAAVGVSAVILTGPARGATATNRADLFAIQHGSFDITIPTTGEILALRQLEIRNHLETGAVISSIVDEGTFVSVGDLLLELNDETIREQIQEQQTVVNTARNSLASSEANLAIRRSEAESQIETADLNIRVAELSMKAWEQGTVPSTRQDLELRLATAQKDYERLVARYQAAENLLEKEFISLDEYRQDEIEMIRAKSDLEQAKLALKVFDEYQYERDKADLESQVEQAHDDRERLALVTRSEIDSAVSEVESRKFSLQNEEARLDKLERQLDACTVEAPTDGMVVYASSIESGNNWRDDEDPPQIGTELSRNQLVMILPDTSRMVAEVKIGEGLSGLIQPGQRAAVMTDAMEGRIYPGVVQSIGVLAESQGWRGPNRRDYNVRIVLDGNGTALGLKPSLRCEAHVYVGQVIDSLYAPVHAIHYAGGVSYVFMETSAGFEARPVTVGRASELFIQILEGVEVGDRVLLREPEPNEINGELPQGEEENGQIEDGGEEALPADPMEAASAERLMNVEGEPGDEGAIGDERGERGRRGGRGGPGGFGGLPEGVTMEQVQEWTSVYRETGEWPEGVPDEVREMADRMGSGGGSGMRRGSRRGDGDQRDDDGGDRNDDDNDPDAAAPPAKGETASLGA